MDTDDTREGGDVPKRVDPAISSPGAPTEPQRTPIRIGVAAPAHALALRIAADRGLMAQEALEPEFRDLSSDEAVPRLITGHVDVAVLGIATFLGERVLGWDGVAIGVFGPWAEDRSCAVAIVERSFWQGRRDICDRIVRSASRVIASNGTHKRGPARAVDDPRLDGWWVDCRPSPERLSEVVRWEPGPTAVVLSAALPWAREAPA